MSIKTIIVLAFVMVSASPAVAANQYTDNMTSRVTEVITYAYDSAILFRVENMPKIPGCKGNYLMIPNDAAMDSRHQILSRLLIAYSSKEAVNIGYDGVTCMSSGDIMVYRVG